ncbi:GNAT family N-acetyltransferase [Burkholderia cenocepacia]|uniref:GNAT family N-acetyltransferase n=1 Tax=Burkholderia cenocepacia TaxID=95486 RepID=UPI0019052832|nr:GNAT family protein [Burkholderia cenocepacia]MBJ9695757.1 GNAT family N-acetyltransferase [Burkholderia cenocepacia]MBR8157133.1 GNAT family N-acetyltransferase [Burkholderia cenocepacia]
MKRIVWDEPDRVMHFVAERTGEETYRDCVAIGLEHAGHLVAGVVYQLYTGPGGSMLMHVASDGSRAWLSRAYLAACFRYPFVQMQCRRVTGLVRADNAAAQRFDEHLGFRREGLLRQGCTDGTDMILYGMLASECRYLEGKHHAALLRAA